jgi:hypothetical protein
MRRMIAAAPSSDDSDPASPGARGVRTVEQSVEPVPGRFSRLAAAGKTIGSWLIGAAFRRARHFCLAAGGKAAARVQPYVYKVSTAILAIVLPERIVLHRISR